MNDIKKENVMVVVTSIILVIVLLACLGAENIKLWLFSPIIWNDPNYINVTLLEKKEHSSRMELEFSISNESTDDLLGFEIYVISNSTIINLSYPHGLRAGEAITINEEFSKSGRQKRLFKELTGCETEDIQFAYHIKKLTGENREPIYKANSWFKPLFLVIVSFVATYLGFLADLKNKYLRIIFKFLGAPSLVILVLFLVLMLFFGQRNSQKNAESDLKDTTADYVANERKSRAAKDYKRLSSLKAGALRTGNTKEAARLQGQMDKAMADMVSSTSSDAAKRYKQSASHKAGALLHGNTKAAARAQSEMDKEMANIIIENNK